MRSPYEAPTGKFYSRQYLDIEYAFQIYHVTLSGAYAISPEKMYGFLELEVESVLYESSFDENGSFSANSTSKKLEYGSCSE